jgi:hypothetical protein
LRIGDDGTQAKSYGFLVWHSRERLVVSQTTIGPLALSVLHSRLHRRGFDVSFPPPTLYHVAAFMAVCFVASALLLDSLLADSAPRFLGCGIPPLLFL